MENLFAFWFLFTRTCYFLWCISFDLENNSHILNLEVLRNTIATKQSQMFVSVLFMKRSQTFKFFLLLYIIFFSMIIITRFTSSLCPLYACIFHLQLPVWNMLSSTSTFLSKLWCLISPLSCWLHLCFLLSLCFVLYMLRHISVSLYLVYILNNYLVFYLHFLVRYILSFIKTYSYIYTFFYLPIFVRYILSPLLFLA